MIDIAMFSGVAPIMDETRLSPGQATDARNVNLESRTVKPWHSTLNVLGMQLSGSTTTIFRFGQDLVSDTQYWFVMSGDVDFVKSPIVGDQTERTIYTGNGAPKWTNNTLALTGGGTYPAAYRDLGVPTPTTKPTAVTGGTALNEDFTFVAYCYTKVTAYGEESAPAPFSDAIEVKTGETPTVSGFDAALTGTQSTTAIRLYRAVAGSGGSNMFFVKEVPEGTASIVDNVGDDVGELLATTGWLPPPSDGFGVFAMANGIHVMFSGNDVCPSEQYVPYAYKHGNRMATDYKIVGGAPIGTSAVVLTVGVPYLLQGTTTESLQLTKLDHPQACVSKRSIVQMDGAVYFASPDGLCAIDDGGNVVVLTETLLTREQWQALNPESIHGHCYNGRYFGFYDDGVNQKGFIFEPQEADAALTWLDFYASGGYVDKAQDHLYLHVGTDIVRWDDSGIFTNAVWKSGVFSTGSRTHQPFIKAKAKAYPFTVKVYGDDPADGSLDLVATITVTGPQLQRMPRVGKFEKWKFEIDTNVEVTRLSLGSAVELRGAE